MSALALFSEFSDRGITIRSDGPNVVVSPEKAITPDLVQRIKKEKPSLIRELEKLQREAGNDWDEIAADPAQLKAFAELLMIVEMREKGICPDHYTATTACKHCGPVPIWDGCPPKVNGCPWCMNRHRGLPIPKEVL
ncbi:MAG: hypothetical protein IID58_13600 [Proteobacteria bacterium]|nr:hypothetical protein [Pseudomonadota bacterium]